MDNPFYKIWKTALMTWSRADADPSIFLFGGFSQDDQYAEDHGQYYADVICRFIHTYGKKFMLVQSAGNDGKNAKYNAFFCSVTEETARGGDQEAELWK